MKSFIGCLLLCCSTFLYAQQEGKDIFYEKLTLISERYPNAPDSAIALFNQVLLSPEVKNDTPKIALVLIAMGREYATKKKEAAIALQYYKKSQLIAQQSNDCKSEINALIFLNTIYFTLNEKAIFLQNYEKAAAISTLCPESKRGVYIHTQIALFYLNKGDTLKGEIHLLKADSVINQQKGISDGTKQFAYSYLVELYKNTNNRSKMLFYAQKEKILLLKSISDTDKRDLFTYSNIIDFFKNIGEIDSALHYAHYLQSLPKEKYSLRNKEAINDANNSLAELYELKGEFKKALFFKNEYATQLDSLLKSSGTDVAIGKINNLEGQLNLEKKERQIERNNFVLALIGTLTALILIILGILYYYFRKLKTVNAHLKIQKEELNTLNTIRTKMFSILSHDMLSPLGGLQNMVDLYHDGTFSQADFKTYTVTLRQNLNAIIKTARDILGWSYTQLNGKKPFTEPLNMYKIVADQFDLQALAAQEKNITLVNNVPPNFVINADFNQMSLIVRNLIDNAIKYTNKGGKVEINAFYTEGVPQLACRDNGIGMSTEEMDRLFNRTDRVVGEKQTQNKSVSLGLEMIYDLLKANNCTIAVESNLNVGSTFTISFQ